MAAGSGEVVQRLLLVDDDEELLASVSTALSRALGIPIDEFTDGAAAVERATTVQYACAVLDMDMPALHGLDVARGLRAQQPGLPILFLTGSSQAFTAAEIAAVGAQGVLAKPVKPAVLAERIEALLRR